MSGRSDLDRFMLACSDLNQPARSQLFQNRPGLKDIKVEPRQAAPSSAFQTSQKARDWSQFDLGDAFSQAAPPPPPPAASQASAGSDADWDEFADFQSCPLPPPAPAGAGAGVSVHAAPGPGSGGLLNGLAPAAAGGGGGDRLVANGWATSALRDPAAPQQDSLPRALPTAPSSLTGPTPLQNGMFAPGAGSSSGLTGGWPGPTEPCAVPAAGYTPVPAVLPAAKPTRFRQGLVPLPSDHHPDGDEFSEFVAAAAPVERRRSGGAGRPPSRLPTLDASPPPRTASPAASLASPAASLDMYAALRGLDSAPANGGELLGVGAASAATGPAQDLLGADVPSASASRAQDLLWADVPAPTSADLPLPLSSAPVSFSTSLGPALSDFSTSLAPPRDLLESEPGPGGLCSPLEAAVPPPPAGPVADEDEDFGEFVCVEQPVAAALSEGGLSAACSRHGSLPSLDLQVAPASDGGQVSPLEADSDATSTAASTKNDRYDSFRQSPLDGDSDAASTAATVKQDRYDSFRQSPLDGGSDAAAATTAKNDRYDSFRQEIMSAPAASESALVAEWRRCLQACYELIQEGVTLFGSVADQYTCSQVAASPQGAHYIDNLSRVYQVAGRIERACERHGCRHQLDLILSETCKAWANLTAFVANSPTRPAVSEVAAPPSGDAATTGSCGVCLLPTDSDEASLACAGRRYHAGCANLWVNRVSDVLPALRP